MTDTSEDARTPEEQGISGTTGIYVYGIVPGGMWKRNRTPPVSAPPRVRSLSYGAARSLL